MTRVTCSRFSRPLSASFRLRPGRCVIPVRLGRHWSFIRMEFLVGWNSGLVQKAKQVAKNWKTTFLKSQIWWEISEQGPSDLSVSLILCLLDLSSVQYSIDKWSFSDCAEWTDCGFEEINGEDVGEVTCRDDASSAESVSSLSVSWTNISTQKGTKICVFPSDLTHDDKLFGSWKYWTRTF